MLVSIWFIALIATIIFEIVTKRKIEKDQISEEPLLKNEKILTWVFCLFNPILGGAILYYGWRKKLPAKAKAANRISWIAFLIVLVVAILNALNT